MASVHSKSDEALVEFKRLIPDLVICGVYLPGAEGLDFIRLLLAEFHNAKVLVVSSYDETIFATRSIKAGAKGYLLADDLTRFIFKALSIVAEGHCYTSRRFVDRMLAHVIHSNDSMDTSPVNHLSDRELEVLILVAQGLKSRLIAERLYVSIKTVQTHRTHIKAKMGFHSSEELRRFAVSWFEDIQSQKSACEC